MRRTILTSFLVIGATLALVFGAAGTFAPFTAEDSIPGTVATGKIAVDLSDIGASPDEANLTFDLDPVCNGQMTPGNPCSVIIEICNGTSVAVGCTASTLTNLEGTISGSVDETGDVTATVAVPNGCFEGTLSAASAGLSIGDADVGDSEGGTDNDAAFSRGEAVDGLDTTDSLDPGEVSSLTLTITVFDHNDCQGKTASYTLSVTLTQSSTPHN